MLLGKPSLLFTLIIAAVSPAACNPVKETNAQRLARGLPPLPPKFGRSLPGRRDETVPTPAWAAKRTTPSSLPLSFYSGRIQARSQDDSILGVIRNSNNSETIGGLNLLGLDQDLQVSFTAPPTGIGPFDILSTNPLFPAPFYVGAAGTTQINSLDMTSSNTIAFTNVQQTLPNSVPVTSTFNEGLMVESAIWSVNPSTKEITAQYINADKSAPTTIIAYDQSANKLFFVGNLAAYNENNAIPASAVRLFIVPA